MNLLQLNPSVPVLTPKGKGRAIVLIDYGEDHHLMWVCAIDDTGEIWTYRNPEVRVHANTTLGTKTVPL